MFGRNEGVQLLMLVAVSVSSFIDLSFMQGSIQGLSKVYHAVRVWLESFGFHGVVIFRVRVFLLNCDFPVNSSLECMYQEM